MAREKALVAYLPAEFNGFLLDCLDPANELHAAFLKRYAKKIEEAGGEETMTSTKQEEIQDSVTLAIVAEGLTLAILSRGPIDFGVFQGLVNAKAGKARSVGIEAKPKRRPTLADYRSGKVSPIK